MLNSKTIELPAREEMERRLVAVNPDENLRSRFYPRLLRYGGKHMLPVGITAVFTAAIHHFDAHKESPEEAVLYLTVDACIDAIVGDADAAQAVKAGIRKLYEIPVPSPSVQLELQPA